jgi:vacuolar-type H+-ATPase subunit H
MNEMEQAYDAGVAAERERCGRIASDAEYTKWKLLAGAKNRGDDEDQRVFSEARETAQDIYDMIASGRPSPY